MPHVITSVEWCDESEFCLTIEDEFDASVAGWAEVSEIIRGMDGIEIIEEVDFKRAEQYEHKMERVVLKFDSPSVLKACESRLYTDGRDRPVGSSEAADVSKFAGVLPTEYELENDLVV